jgi:rubrerythrin
MRHTMRKKDILGCVLLFFALFVVAPWHATAMENKTLADLMAAYNGESNAHAKYLAFAKKADEEGYGKVASLFRAAAEAEEIHLKNHAEVIKGMGGTPKADIKLPEVKSTKENLEDALKGETYERLTMYPEFIAQAKQDNNKAAVRTFTYAKFAEAEHAKLYKEALDNLESWKGAKADFYVCPTCGYTVDGKPSFEACPVCATPANDYILVN